MGEWTKRALRNLGHNLGRAALLVIGARRDECFRYGPTELAVLWGAFAVTVVAVDAYFNTPIGGVSPWGASYALSMALIVFLAIWVSAKVGPRDLRAPRLAHAMVPVFTIWVLFAVATAQLIQSASTISTYYLLMAAPYLVLIRGAYAAHRKLGLAGRLRAAVGAAVLVLIFGLGRDWLIYYPIFEQRLEGAAENAADERRFDMETLYYRQTAMLRGQAALLEEGTPGQVELWAVLVAGDAHQNVFLSEVEAVRDILADTFGAARRVITLANSDDHPHRYPLANPPNLREALRLVGAQMDRDEDVLLVFITSHGTDELISANFYPVRPNDFTPSGLAQAVAVSGAQNVALILSACHSGSFVPHFKRSNMLVATAAAAEKNSFGCSDKNEWTWFGDAFFNHAIRETPDLAVAFKQASALISEWEANAGYEPSDPQLWIGEAIAPVLDKLAESAAAGTDVADGQPLSPSSPPLPAPR